MQPRPTTICPRCGAPSFGAYPFCGRCGQDLRGVAPTSPDMPTEKVSIAPGRTAWPARQDPPGTARSLGDPRPPVSSAPSPSTRPGAAAGRPWAPAPLPTPPAGVPPPSYRPGSIPLPARRPPAAAGYPVAGRRAVAGRERRRLLAWGIAAGVVGVLVVAIALLAPRLASP